MGGNAVFGRRFWNIEGWYIATKIQWALAPGLHNMLVCGSVRRGRLDCGDLDLVMLPGDPARLLYLITAYFGPGPLERAVLVDGVQVDLIVATADNFWAQVLHWTGSKEENIRLRALAVKRGYKLSQEGLTEVATGRLIRLQSERHLYDLLGSRYREPHQRG